MLKSIYTKPYIESILESLSAEQRSKLLEIVNSSYSTDVLLIKLNDEKFACSSERLGGETVKSVKIQFTPGVDSIGIILNSSNDIWYFLKPDYPTLKTFEIYILLVTDGILTDFIKRSEIVTAEEFRRAITDCGSSGGSSGGGGIKLYRHKITPIGSGYTYTFYITNTKNTPYTIESFIEDINSVNYLEMYMLGNQNVKRNVIQFGTIGLNPNFFIARFGSSISEDTMRTIIDPGTTSLTDIIEEL